VEGDDTMSATPDHAIELRPGARLESVVCSTQVVVVRTGSAIDLRCGGYPMAPFGSGGTDDTPPHEAYASGALLGKRYADAESGLEVLCTCAGEGTLALGDRPLVLREAKRLPSSD
jgi:hypothetical protein